MKRIISLLLVATLVLSCGLLVGCGDKKEKAKEAATEIATKAKEVATKAEEKKDDVSKAVETKKEKATKELSSKEKALEEASKAMNKKPPKKPTVHGNGIVGKWEYNQKAYKIPAIYTFKKDGTGNYNLAGQIKNLKWKTKGGKITITFTGEGDMNQKYKLKGDVLTLYDISDSPVEYYRVG